MFYAYKLDSWTTVLYGWLNTGYCNYLSCDYEYDPEIYEYRRTEETLSAIGFGLGFGVDFILSNNFSLPIKVGYIGSYSNKENFLMDVSLNFGFRYRF